MRQLHIPTGKNNGNSSGLGHRQTWFGMPALPRVSCVPVHRTLSGAAWQRPCLWWQSVCRDGVSVVTGCPWEQGPCLLVYVGERKGRSSLFRCFSKSLLSQPSNCLTLGKIQVSRPGLWEEKGIMGLFCLVEHPAPSDALG